MRSNDPFIDAMHTWNHIFMQRSMRKFFLFTKENNLSMAQIGALFNIHGRTVSVSEIGEVMGVTSAAASQMLERLVQLGFISRIEDPVDRRIKQIVITPAGKEMLVKSVDARQEWLKELEKVLTEEEKAQIVAALKILIEKSEQLSGDFTPHP